MVNSPVAVGWSSCLGTLDFPRENLADRVGLPNEVFPTDTGEVMAVVAPLPTALWSTTDGTAQINVGRSSWLGTFDLCKENWPLSSCTPPRDWSCLFDGMGELWIETTRFLAFTAEVESFTEFLAGAGYLTGFISEGQTETRFAISAGGVVRFEAESETEFVPQLSPATPNWGSGGMPPPPSRRRNYGF